jgi:DNA mismatch repair protein MutS2
MTSGALRALEFTRIIEVVRGFALTPTGAGRLGELKPSTDPQRVQQMQAATTEGVRYLSGNPLFPLRAPSDLGALLNALAIQGRAIEPLRLLALADLFDSIELTRTAIRRVGAAFPILRGLAEAAASFKGEAADVRQKIEPSGEIVDHASAELKGIRERLRKQRTRLRGILESYLRGKETAKYLQDQVVTDRAGRYVLVVRAEHRSAIPGIVHGSSTSGASLFLEPLSTVEINNDIVALQEQEAEEIHRILLALTDAFRRRAGDVQRTLEVATELDVIQAKARFADLTAAAEPILTTDGRFELRAARHPLLMPAVASRLDPPAERATDPVPVDILLTPPTTVLLITGPNTGGKTVALKTAGLCALMAQAGLHIPAASGSRVPVFRSVFADIGDEQSISASLSTFSSHMTNIASMDRSLALPALVLLDEIGAGTDPIEGGALGVAIVENFRARGALVISTSHYDALKTYASTTAGVTGAAFGFNPETFEPSYLLLYGSPGRSLALEIAARLGLNAGIVAAARGNLTQREAQLADHLARIDEDMRNLDHERRLIARERETLGDAESRMRGREEVLRQREELFKRRLNEALDARLREARNEIDVIMTDLKRRTAELAAQAARHAVEAPVPTGEAGSAKSDARTAVDAVIDRFRPEHPEAPAATTISHARAAVGDRVTVGGLGLDGVVTGIHDGHADVDVRGKRLRASLDDLRVVASGTTAAPAKVNVNVHVQPRDGMSTDLNVIGCTVDEAIGRAEKFLDEMLLTDQRTVRLIHGYGTGQLRRAIGEFLQRHPFVSKYELAPPGQGGGGVTVVELKE